jgi:hypothetical protein
MTELSKLQGFVAELLRRRGALPKDAELSRLVAQHVSGNDRLSPIEQLEIYREQFWLRHTSALVEDFPGLGGILGQEDWQRLVEGYLLERAPTSFSLRDLGEGLPAFVERSTWLPERRLCTDMARLEWAYVEVFDAPDAGKLEPDRLAALPLDAWETARCVLSPALRLLPVRYPVADLRRALKRSTENGEAVPLPAEMPQNLVIYRGTNLRIFDKEVGDAAFGLLHALAEGEPLLTACERAAAVAAARSETIESELQGWFASFGELGFIVDVRVEDRTDPL